MNGWMDGQIERKTGCKNGYERSMKWMNLTLIGQMNKGYSERGQYRGGAQTSYNLVGVLTCRAEKRTVEESRADHLEQR